MAWGLDALIQLADAYEECDKCPLLCETRTGVVFGGGNTRADLMIIGEAPGASEDEEGLPFVGKAGQLLMDMINQRWPKTDKLLDIQKLEDDEEFFEALRDYLDDYIFWTNTTLCWTGDDKRPPSIKELKACRDRLHRTIYAVDPMLIFVAGKTAATALVGKTVGIMKSHGQIFDITIISPVTGRKVRYPALAILHPGSLVRHGDQALVSRKSGDTYDTIEDIGYGFELLDEQYNDLFGTSFPDRPREYKKL